MVNGIHLRTLADLFAIKPVVVNEQKRAKYLRWQVCRCGAHKNCQFRENFMQAGQCTFNIFIYACTFLYILH